MELYQAIVLAVIQGVTELFPVSSLGHAVVLPHLFGWSIDQEGDTFLPFLVLLHVGTALALLIYFWRDWWLLLSSLIDRRRQPRAQRVASFAAAAGHRHHPRRPDRPGVPSQPRRAVFGMATGGGLPDAQRRDADGGRVPAPARGQRHAGQPQAVAGGGHRHESGHRAVARLLALGRNRGRRPAGRASSTSPRRGSRSCWRRRSSSPPA